MLNSETKNCASRDKKNEYSNSCFVGNFFSERNKKTITPPSPPPPPSLQVKWSVPK